MGDVDPDMLLEWLEMGQGDVRDMQLIALEQLCMLLLMSDNIDQCFESCPPRTFLPALCTIFMDESAPENILEATARAMRFYLDVSAECTRRIVSVDGAVKALCDRLSKRSDTRTGKDLSEQCIKVLEFMVTREAGLIFQAGGLPAILSFISDNQATTHKDILHSAMAVVSKLCTKCEPTDETLPECVITLSSLLDHADNQVSDGALRCFASLSDRFTRKNIDPAPIGHHGLVENLLSRLTVALPSSFTPTRSNTSGNRPQTGNSQTTSEGTVSMVISLLTALCRGSDSITTKLLHSNLAEALTSALLANERCVLDTMRFIDLLLLLMFEGRSKLPHTNQPTVTSSNHANDSANHKQLIDRIRGKDSNGLIELMESGNYDVNFMDDVGQTLLNWASAFGTLTMVEYLVKRGADVNRGQRSSSLHYTACFGRPAIAKALLRSGANPDLRDEDGKTPLDRAREKNDEGHREVVHILQNPGEWMMNEESGEASASTSDTAPVQKETPAEEEAGDEVQTPWVRDDELIVKYLKYWIPQFTDIFQNTLYTSVKKSALTLLRKIVRYTTLNIVQALCEEGAPYSAQIVETIAYVLEEEGDENKVPALSMVRDLCEKGADNFMDHFCRLGVINHISKRAKVFAEEKLKSDKEDQYMEDAVEVLPYRPYHWCQWSVLHAKECIYIWCDYTAIALSSGSNGWFSFIMDGKLSTIYSAGCLDSSGTDTSDSRCEFLEKLQRAKCQVASDKPSQPILSTPGNTIALDKWRLKCRREGELAIDNVEGQQSTVLREDLPGFIFESNKGATHSFNAELTLGAEFAAGWGKKTCKVKSKSKQLQQQINVLSEEIYLTYFENKMNHMRPVVAKLKEILDDMDRAVTMHNDAKSESEWRTLLSSSFRALAELLHKDTSLSTFELNSCQLVPCMLRALSYSDVKSGVSCTSVKQQNALNTSLHKSQERIEVFKECFLNGSLAQEEIATNLVKKLVSVMESVENLPLYLYESPGALYSLQILTKRLRFRLERYAGEHSLLDRSGRTLKIEPMTAVSTLEEYLRKNVAKQWFDYDRSTYKFIREVKEGGSVKFTNTSDFDENGIIYWIGTNGRTSKEWKNPSSIKAVVLSSSDGRNLPYGSLDDVLSRTGAAKNVHTSDDKNGWISVDLALWVIPSHYTLRHSRGFGRSALRNWLFQVSKDSKAWVTLRSHTDDTSLSEPGSTATWELEPPPDEKQGWRHMRVHVNGKNASGHSHYLSVSGFELYGTVTGVCDDPPVELLPTKPPPLMMGADKVLKRLNRDSDSLMCRQRLRIYRKQTAAQVLRNLGSRPSRVDWKALQSDTESIKSCSSTGEGVPGTPDSTEAVGGSETLSIATISSTPDVGTVDELEDAGSVASRQDTLNTFNQRNLATDLENFVLELAQAVMDTTDRSSDRNTVCTINELLGAMPHRTQRSAADVLLSQLADQVSRPGPSSSNTVQQNNSLNKVDGEDKDNFAEEEDDEEDDEAADEEEFSDIADTPEDPKEGITPTDTVTKDLSLTEIIPSLPEEVALPEEGSDQTSRTNSSSDYLTPDSENGGEVITQNDDVIAPNDDVITANEADEETPQEGDTPENETGETAQPSAEPDQVAAASNVEMLDSVAHEFSSEPDFSEDAAPSLEHDSSSSSSGSSNDITDRQKPPSVSSGDPNTSDAPDSFASDTYYPYFPQRNLLTEFSDIPLNLQSLQRNPGDQESPSTPTNDLSTQGGASTSAVEVPPEGGSVEEEGHNIPVGGQSGHKRELPDWHKPRFPGRSSVGERLEFLSFDDSDLVGEGIAHPEDMDIEDDEEDDDDEEGMEFGIDLESDEDAEDQRPLKRRVWDDDIVLKRQFSALIPAFDPRPGRNNVAHTTDIDIAAPGPDCFETYSVKVHKDVTLKPRLALFIRCPALPGSKAVEYLCPHDKTVFSCLVEMTCREKAGYLPSTNVRRFWEPTYTLVYRETRPSDMYRLLNQKQDPFETSPFKPRWDHDFVRKYLGTERLPKLELLNYLQSHADSVWLKKWRLTGSPKTIKKSKSCSNLANAYKDFIQHCVIAPGRETEHEWYKEFSQCLHLLNIVYTALVQVDVSISEDSLTGTPSIVSPNSFHSSRLTTRLMQQVQEPLMLGTRSIPGWCDRLVNQYPMLIPFETRSVYFNATAFGISRSIHWLQSLRDTTEQRPRTVATRRVDEMGDFRIGRLKHERCTIPRGEDFLDWALQVLTAHAHDKSVLEIEFRGEEGTGIGPTLEFYSLVAAELQRKELGIWVCDDEEPPGSESDGVELDLGQGPKPRGYYVKSGTYGLFPAPYPQDSPKLTKICSLFHLLGMFVGKSLQDQRLVDLPLSLPFFKMLCRGTTSEHVSDTNSDLGDHSDSEGTSESFLLKSESLSSLTEGELRFRCDSDAASDISSVQGTSCHEDSTTDSLSRKPAPLTIEDIAVDTSSESSSYTKTETRPATDRQLESRSDRHQQAWFSGILNNNDFTTTNPYLAKFLGSLDVLSEEKRAVLSDSTLSETQKQEKLESLTLPGTNAKLEDLCLFFQFTPSSTVYGYTEFDLKPGGQNIPLSLQNIEEYCDLSRSFCLDTGIRRQMEAFKGGFNTVFSLSHVKMFTPQEFRLLLCGEMVPDWTRSDLLEYTEPKFGYTRESPGFLNLVEVLLEMSGPERKNFLQFATGCSALPPGGLANLNPRLTVVRKEGEGGDSCLPSVNTCVHYLKLPEYSSKQVLRERLLQSTQEKGFHLN